MERAYAPGVTYSSTLRALLGLTVRVDSQAGLGFQAFSKQNCKVCSINKIALD